MKTPDEQSICFLLVPLKKFYKITFKGPGLFLSVCVRKALDAG